MLWDRDLGDKRKKGPNSNKHCPLPTSKGRGNEYKLTNVTF